MAGACAETLIWNGCKRLRVRITGPCARVGLDQQEIEMLDLINVNYDTMIPNNVGLSEDRKVLKALEKWHQGISIGGMI